MANHGSLEFQTPGGGSAPQNLDFPLSYVAIELLTDLIRADNAALPAWRSIKYKFVQDPESVQAVNSCSTPAEGIRLTLRLWISQKGAGATLQQFVDLITAEALNHLAGKVMEQVVKIRSVSRQEVSTRGAASLSVPAASTSSADYAIAIGRRYQFENSPDYKRKKRPDTWTDIAAGILYRHKEFLEKWHPVLLALRLADYQQPKELQSRRFASDVEFEEFLLCRLRDWTYEDPEAASAANLVGFLFVHRFPGLAEQIRKEVHATATATAEKRRSWMQAYPTQPTFVGRQLPLLQLHRTVLEAHRAVYTAKAPCVVLHGLGGMGKTLLVRFYARAFADYFDGNVLSIAADDKSTMRQSFRKLAADLQLDIPPGASDVQLAARCYEYFSTRLKCRSLFIFDNAESYNGVDDGVAEFLPICGAGHLSEESVFDKAPNVILTSRIGAPAEWPPEEFKILLLAAWEPTESLDFLRCTLPPGGTDAAHARLAEELGHYPLALQQATGFITSANSPQGARFLFKSVDERIDRFLDAFRSERERERGLQQILEFNPSRTYKDTAHAILKLALEKIGDHPRRLMTRLSFLGPDKVPVDWLWDDKAEAEAEDGGVAAAVETLQNFSLITVSTDDDGACRHLQVHRLVQKFIRQHQAAQPRPTNSPRIEEDVLAMLAPRMWDVTTVLAQDSVGIPKLTADQKLCVAHSKEFCRHVLSHELFPFERLDELHSFGVTHICKALWALDEDPEALALAEGLAKMFVARGMEPDAVEVLEARILTGRMVLRRGSERVREARDRFQAIVEAASDPGGHEEPEGRPKPGLECIWLEATFQLGWAFNRLPKMWDAARKWYSACLNVAATMEGRMALRYELYATSGLAGVDRAQKGHARDLERALGAYRSILQRSDWIEVLGDDERVQIIFQQTAYVLKLLRRYDEAVEVLRVGLAHVEPKYGPHARLTLLAKVNLVEGLLDTGLGGLDEAETIVQDIYDLVLEKFGTVYMATYLLEEHRLKIRELRATAPRGAAAPSECERLRVLGEVCAGHLAILASKREQMGLSDGHVEVIRVERKLCELAAARGEYTKALEDGKKVVEKQKRLGWDAQHEDRVSMEKFLADCERKKSRLSLADADHIRK